MVFRAKPAFHLIYELQVEAQSAAAIHTKRRGKRRKNNTSMFERDRLTRVDLHGSGMV
jgi:hypothetical protein